MTARATAACLAVVLSAVTVPAHGQSLVDNLVASAEPQPFSSDDLLWMEVQVDGRQAAESMDVYASRSGVFIPIAQFSRVLDLAIAAFPSQRRAEGWVLSPDRKIVVDLATRTATAGGKSIPFAPDQAAIYDDDVYVRIDLLEQLLPMRLKPNVSAQLLSVSPTEPLPFQQRQVREQRRSELGNQPRSEKRAIVVPYSLFSPPAFDVNIGGQLSRDGDDLGRSFDARAAGDLLYGTVQAFVGSDQDGEISDARVTWERKDPGGRALGALGGTRAGLGDVFTPSMALGAGSSGGRGIFYTSAPLDNLDISTPLDIRGELALGEEVELYVNEVLQASRASAVQGRYEFLDVPLTVGLNTVRLVFYGSQGQTREEVRRINFGAGQLEAGQVSVRLGAVQQDIAVIDLGRRVETREVGAPRVVAMIDYGVTNSLTVSAGLARYSPVGGDARSAGSVGLRGSLGGWAVQGDLGVDDRGGRAASASVAGRPFGVSLVGQHSEYRGGFIDETRPFGALDDVRLERATDVRADAQLALTKQFTLPLSVSLQHAQRVDGSSLVTSEIRTSAPIAHYYVSTNLAYERERLSTDITRERLVGGVDLATLVAARLQLRGGLTYEIRPSTTLETAYASAEWQLSEATAVRLGVVQALGPQGTTTVQGSALYRARRFDLALNAGYDTSSSEWRLGVQLGFGFGYDPFAGRYRMTRPGVSGGGAVAFNAFVDANGDGVRQPGEAGVPKVVVETPGGAVVTDANGRALGVGLGDGARAQVRVTTEGVDDPFLLGGAGTLEMVPRPGRIAMIDYPMQVSGELELVARIVRPEGPARPLSALGVELVPAGGGAPVAARSDHSGVLYFEGVRPGVYEVRLAPEQASALGLALAAPLRVTIPAGGGFIRGGEVLVKVAKEAAS